MENIENKLVEYRLRRRREEKLQNLKESCRRLLMIGAKDRTGQEAIVTVQEEELDKEIDSGTTDGVECLKGLKDCDNDSLSFAGSEDDLDKLHMYESSNENRFLKYALWSVYLLFWITLYVIAIELQFGIVYLMLSILVGIYCNTRTGPKKPDEISAYSVFNKNCESIDGTLKAEQFEREMGIR
uniref:SAYSvFN domain-containing protein n=1 Tax=Glossina pallidipes TaxID=7398 RepID=A0A1B0A1H7_GLOPL